MHSQRYDTYEAASDTIHPYYDSIQHNAIRCNGKNDFYYFFGSDRQQIINELMSSDF